MMHSLATLVPDEPGAPVVTVLRIGGDVDAADQSPLDRLLRRIDGGWVHVDLSDLGFAGALLLDRLVQLSRRLEGADDRLTVGPVPPRLARLLVLLALEEHFDLRSDPRAALSDAWCSSASAR